ncbi:MAG: ABC transporter permease [Clostridiales bacterium]|nr:ABC transporter permease [Clostridiales bacterium]
MRSFRTPAIFTAYACILLLMSLSQVLWTLRQGFVTVSGMRAGIDGYIWMTFLQFALIVLIAPAMTAGSIASERERQTLDLILVTQTGAFKIALGKLLDGFLFLGVLVISSAPFLSLVFLTGGITPLQVARTLLFLMVSAFAALSVGLFASALFKRTAAAAVTAYLIVFAIGLGTLIPLFNGAQNAIARLANDAALMQSITTEQALALIPKSALVNPAIGLVSLLVDQTELIRQTFSGAIPYGYVYYSLFEEIRFDIVANINMAIMAGLGLCFALAAAALIRPRARRIARIRRGAAR